MVNTELLNTLLTIACQFLIEMSVTGKTTHILRMHRYFWLLKKPNDIKLIGMNEFKGTQLLKNPTKVTREKFVVFTGRSSYDLFDIEIMSQKKKNTYLYGSSFQFHLLPVSSASSYF